MKTSPFLIDDPTSFPRSAVVDDDILPSRDRRRADARPTSLRMCVGPPISPSAELEYWRLHHPFQRFALGAWTYDDFEPAYRCGLLQYLREPFVPFERAEALLERLWPSRRERSALLWPVARFAALAAWKRAHARAEAIVRGQE